MATPILSAAAEKRLIRQVQSPDPSIASKAFSRLEKIFEGFISRYKWCIKYSPFEEAEILQDLRRAFYQAVRNHDASKGVSLSGFAASYLDGAVKRYLKKRKSQYHTSLEASEQSFYPLEDLVRTQALRPSVHQLTVRNQVTVPAVRQFIEALPSSQRDVAVRMVTFDETQSEAAESLGRSRQAVSRSYSRIIEAGRQQFSFFAPE